jgi:hypothetical protein
MPNTRTVQNKVPTVLSKQRAELDIPDKFPAGDSTSELDNPDKFWFRTGLNIIGKRNLFRIKKNLISKSSLPSSLPEGSSHKLFDKLGAAQKSAERQTQALYKNNPRF